MTRQSLAELAENLVLLLRRRSWCLASAESCTGGLIAAAVTAIPGASQAFWGGVVAYSDESKKKLLGVSTALLQTEGAVSAACAAAMAKGVQALGACTCSIAVTGIAGPGGGSPEKPVGLVWFGLTFGGEAWTFQEHFHGNREAIQYQSAHKALSLLLTILGQDHG